MELVKRMISLPFEKDIDTTNLILYNFFKSKHINDDNKKYIGKSCIGIQKWSLAYILNKIKQN